MKRLRVARREWGADGNGVQTTNNSPVIGQGIGDGEWGTDHEYSPAIVHSLSAAQFARETSLRSSAVKFYQSNPPVGGADERLQISAAHR